jgi:hypothetical protein
LYEKEYSLIEAEFNKKKPVEFIKFLAANFKTSQWTEEFGDDDYKKENIERTNSTIVSFLHPDCS